MSEREPVVYKGIRALLAPGYKLIMRPKIIGKENIPKNTRAVLAGNHKKPTDILILSASTRRCLHYLAKIELFKGPIGKVFKSAGIIPVDRSKKNPDALKAAKDYLNKEGVITIFPEGTTNKTDAVLLPFKIGAVKMARDTNSPIIPFTIKGEHKLFGKRPELHFYPPYYVGDEDLAVENEKFRDYIYQKLAN
ncbi:MAG: 1-acyl-sn-glycerol-3-phosphate acyltransferase [Clostridia bacterium]|nr:1-acyl-sn-glycerol-3-phosphate acyltransferase [Clostridia bacterium]